MGGYSGASSAKQARENLARALAALQEDRHIPPDVLAITQNIAGAVGALFEAERASSETDGKSSVKNALGSVSQTLALLQEVRSQHQGVQVATEAIAQTLSLLFPLSTQPSRMPPPMAQAPGYQAPQGFHPQGAAQGFQQPQSFQQPQNSPAPIPLVNAVAGPGATVALSQQGQPVPSQPPGQRVSHRPPAPQFAPNQPRNHLEVNIGATTESNFFVGFSGEIREGGVFAATYNILQKGAPVRVLVTLPGGFEKEVNGYVRFVRDPMDFSSESEPGIGIQFEYLDDEGRELILRFIRKRAPMFYDE